MGRQFIGSSVVVVAQQFNPSVMSQLWLVGNGLATEDDFRQGYIFSDSVVQFQTREFQILVVPEQLQFSPKVEAAREQEVIRAKIGAIVETLPHTPYRAVGLNFMWQVTPEMESVQTLSRRLFFRDDIPLFGAFDPADARFGAYLSKDSFGGRLRLEIKPITLKTADRTVESLNFGFNYNLDVAESNDRISAILGMLERWNEAMAESIRIVEAAERGQTV